MLPENEVSREKILFYIFDLFFFLRKITIFPIVLLFTAHPVYNNFNCLIRDNSFRTSQLKLELFSSIEKFRFLVPDTIPLISNMSQ